MGILRDLNKIAATGNESMMIQFLSDESNRSARSEHAFRSESYEAAVRQPRARRSILRHNQEIAYAATTQR